MQPIDRYILTGSGLGLRYSSDGCVTYTSAASVNAVSTLYAAAWSGTVAIARATNGPVFGYTSPDGITWTATATPSGLMSIIPIWSGTVFVSPMVAGGIETSPDGITWTVDAD